jgi:carbamoyltransferase
MNILGINFGHDASLALFSDGELIQFEELERSTRLKHQYGVTSDQIENFLKRINLKITDINLVAMCSTQYWSLPHSGDIEISHGVFSDMHRNIFGDIHQFGAKNYHKFHPVNGGGYYANQLKVQKITHATMSPVAKELKYSYIQGFDFSGETLECEFQKVIGMDGKHLGQMQAEFLLPGMMHIKDVQLPFFYVDHHYCHANYAYFYSPKAQSLVATHDGGLPSAPFNSGGIYLANERGVIPIVDHRLFLGCLYDQIAGYAKVGDSGKLMGLSSYAVADYASVGIVQDVIACTSQLFNRPEIDKLVNKVISFSSDKVLTRNNKIKKFRFDEKISSSHIQAAANIQATVESIFIHTVGATASLLADIDDNYASLNLTGGFTLNCPTNNALKQKFQNLTVNPLPGCGDTGISIGACVAIYSLLNADLKRPQDVDLAAAFPPLNLKSEFGESDFTSFNLQKLDSEVSIPDFIAKAVVDKKIMCLFRGRSEVGPRALGRRSIVAHAIHEDIRDVINQSKGREMWRPLAPICRDDDYADYFDGDAYDSRYMLFTNRVKNSSLKGVTHVDGSARAQAITSQDIWLYEALGKIKQQGQTPVIINTSFNCAGEPIVETIQDAFRSFAKMNFDYLITEYGIFVKNLDTLVD